MSFDAHARPPESMRALFKKWQKSSLADIDRSDEVIDASRLESKSYLQIRGTTGPSREQLLQAFENFQPLENFIETCSPCKYFAAFEITTLPGLLIYPSIIPRHIQLALLNKMVHRDLSDPSHKSNLHLHYNIDYPQNTVDSDGSYMNQSFFLADPTTVLSPKDPSVHKPLTIRQMLERKLRWMTLGGQYDWTAKVYPSDIPPKFPEDIASLLKGMFPSVDAQAAIVNFYTPGDTLSVHRDVSEECDRGLISLSIGCDCLFVVGNEDGTHSATLRLRSGDVVLMSGTSRYAWHAVPKILANTCPDWLRPWPANDLDVTSNAWRGWMANKRINLNVRQMRR